MPSTIVLAAALAMPCPEPDARAFDFWVGDWNVVNRWRTDAGAWVDAGRATNQVFHVLDGCAVVELWDGNLGANRFLGFSIRAWDPAANEWVLVLNWPRPGRPQFNVLRGGFRHARGEFFSASTNEQGEPVRTRYTFSDITDRTLRWNDGTSLDGGATWATRWIMEFTRRDPRTDPPLHNLPLVDPDRTRLCPAEGARAFDPYLGRWSTADGSAQLESLAILGECAVLDQLEWRDSSGALHQAVFVRAPDPDVGGWVQYALDTDHRAFIRYEGSGPDELAAATGGAMWWSRSDDGFTMRLTWDGAPGAARVFELAKVR